jgi:hypothetical protein
MRIPTLKVLGLLAICATGAQQNLKIVLLRFSFRVLPSKTAALRSLEDFK